MADAYGQVDVGVHTLSATNSSRYDEQPSPDYIAEAVSFLHKDGIIVLEDVVASSHLDHLNSILSSEALEIANNPSHHFNFGRNTRNMDQAPPPTLELMYKDIWANSFVCAILNAVLGPKPVIHYANGNTALKASPDGRQPVHSDCEFAHPVYFPFALVINIPLVDTSEENGATEVWPGSHHVSTQDCHTPAAGDFALSVKPEFVEQRRNHSPPVRACTKKGSIIIRDLRLWHAGMPNLTEIPRIMLAFVAQPAWWQGRGKVKLPVSVEPLVESWKDITFAADWIDGDVDHKTLSSEDVDFGSGSPAMKKYEHLMSKLPSAMPRWF